MRQIVTLGSPEFDKEAVELFARLGFTVLRAIEELAVFVVDGDYLLSADDYGIIQEVHEDAPIKPMYVPNDTYYSSQSYLQKLNLEAAWDRATGTNVVIADCNSGVATGVSEFSGQVLTGWNVVAGNTTTTPDSGVVHGTFCAGIMIALSNNSAGVTGVAFNAQLLPIRMDTPGTSGSAYSSDIISAITYAANQSSVSVINVSYLLMESYSAFSAVVTYAASQGKLVVISAGNNTTVISNPSPEGLVVSSIDNGYGYSSFSDYGAAVDITAVGEAVYSTTGVGGYGAGNGTSYSTPQVAGVAALIKGIYPQYNAYDLKAILVASANRNPAGSSWGTGRNDRVGAGLVDAMAALNTSYSRSWVRLKYKNPVALISTVLDGEMMLAGVNTTITLTTKAIYASIASRAFAIDGVDQGTTFTGDSTAVTLNLTVGNHILTLTVTDSVGGVTAFTSTIKVAQASNVTATGVNIPSRVPAGKTLQFRVRAKNVSGTSAWTGWTSVNAATSSTLPTAPRLAEVYNNGANAELYHERMSNATGYQYSINGGTAVTASGYPIVIARTGAAQTVTVNAVYGSGAGIPSQAYSIDPVPAVADFTAAFSVSSASVPLTAVASTQTNTATAPSVSQANALVAVACTEAGSSTLTAAAQAHAVSAVASSRASSSTLATVVQVHAVSAVASVQAGTSSALAVTVGAATVLVGASASQTSASEVAAVAQAHNITPVASGQASAADINEVAQAHALIDVAGTQIGASALTTIAQAYTLSSVASTQAVASSAPAVFVGVITNLTGAPSDRQNFSTFVSVVQAHALSSVGSSQTGTSTFMSVSVTALPLTTDPRHTATVSFKEYSALLKPPNNSAYSALLKPPNNSAYYRG